MGSGNGSGTPASGRDGLLDVATEQLYAGATTAVRSLHDAVLELTHACGEDVTARSTGSSIELVRRTAFLDLRPGRGDSLRVGLWFPGGVPHEMRADVLAEAGGHSTYLEADALDEDVIALEPLIEAAYDQNG